LFFSARLVSVDDLAEELLADKIFFSNSGGGVTLSGGEVLAQAKFASLLIRRLKSYGVHVIVETSGYGSSANMLLVAEDADEIYFDFKLFEEKAFKALTGGNVEVVTRNLELLAATGKDVTLRVPLIPGITDTEENVLHAYETAKKLNVKEVHLLPYNASSGAKYAWIGREYSLGGISLDDERCAKLKEIAPEDLRVAIQR
jgi:pyruvate formate lyase activating enzyme